jgi:pSer/pThr/pTyr-binding forkhead associated (FHA) protein/PAS domain-containing protein
MVLFIISGLKSGKVKEYELEYGSYLMGRSKDCDIRISDKSISRKHAEIYYSKKELIIAEVGSANGIFVNAIKVKEAKLYDGDEISVKGIKIKVECEFTKSGATEKVKPFSDIINQKSGPTAKIEPGADPFGGPGDPNEDSVFGLELDGADRDAAEISRAFELGETKAKEDLGVLDDSLQIDPGEYEDKILDVEPALTINSKPPRQKDIKLNEQTKMEGQGSLVAILLKPIKGILKGIENATIKPIVNIILQFEYRLLVYMFTAMGITLIALMVLIPQKENMEQYLVNEALTHAESIAHFLAKGNREQLIRDDYHQLDVKLALEIKNVQRARIIRRDGKIVAPVHEKYNDVSQPHLVAAVDAMRKGQVADIQRVSKNVRSIVRPIKAFTADNVAFDSQRGSRTDNEEIIGIAQIEYSLDNIFTGDPYTAITSEALGIQVLTCLIIGFVAAFFITKLITPALTKITKDLKEAQKKGRFAPKQYLRMKEFEALVKALADYVSHSGQGGSVDADDLLALGDGDDLSGAAHDTVEAYQCALHVLDIGVIVMDADQTIVIANDSFARQMQYGDKSSVEGQPLASIINDIDTTDKISALIDRVNSSSETIVTEPIEMSGYDNNISICKSDGGNFYALLIKETGF